MDVCFENGEEVGVKENLLYFTECGDSYGRSLHDVILIFVSC